MNSRKEEERNEKIIRGLMKLPPNRKCINCNSLGPQYVCTNFWTFVCIACSGIHREFTHRVKSVSMAKFTKQEVEALQRGGNQRARELFLKDWDIQRMRFPDSSNPDKIREFIKNVYVDKKYAGGNSSDKLPRDMQTLKNFEEDQRRASSYHSYSQSPPYENQYEERRYGKQCGALTRRPGSDRGLYERKISSFMYSPGHLREHAYEDRFANDSTGPRISDYSVSSAGDPVRFDGQSSNLHATVYNSLPSQQVRDILIQDARTHIQHTHSLPNMKENFDQNPRSHRTMSSGSFGSFDSNSISLKSVNSGSFADVLESEHPSRAQQMETLILPTSSQSSTSPCFVNHDLFSVPFVQPPMTTSAQPVDLFANINHQSSSTSPSGQILAEVSQPENEGWATFDIPHNVGHASERNDLKNARLPVKEGGHIESIDAFQPMHNKSQWFPLQSSAPVGPFQSIADQWHAGTHEVKKLSDAKDFKPWNAFDDLSTGNVSQSLFGSPPLDNESQGPAHKPPTSGDYVALEVPKDSVMNVFQKSTGDDMIAGFNTSFNDVTGSSFLSSILPLMEGNVQEHKSTNPFDLPFDSDVESNNAFVDMSSLQAALPNPQLPPAFLGGLSEQYFPQSSVNAYISPVPQGLGLPYTEGQALSLQLPNIPQQGPVASLGGNPFA